MTYTLIADGSSDRVLLPLLTWTLRRHGVREVEAQWADPRWLPMQEGLRGRVRAALSDFPCDVLFIHRDAERESAEVREVEILTATRGVNGRNIPVIPVRMTEAWLLFDEQAVRNAAGNPNGRQDLQLPEPARYETIPNPKEILHRAIQVASELPGRRRAKLSVPERVHRVAHGIDDFSPLLGLGSFRALQEKVATFLSGHSDRANRG